MILLPHHHWNDYKFQCLHLFNETLALVFELLYHHRSHIPRNGKKKERCLLITNKIETHIQRRKSGIYSEGLSK